MCGLMSDLVNCKFGKSMVIQSCMVIRTECPYCDQPSLNNTDQTKPIWHLSQLDWLILKVRGGGPGPWEKDEVSESQLSSVLEVLVSRVSEKWVRFFMENRSLIFDYDPFVPIWCLCIESREKKKLSHMERILSKYPTLSQKDLKDINRHFAHNRSLTGAVWSFPWRTAETVITLWSWPMRIFFFFFSSFLQRMKLSTLWYSESALWS